MRTEKLANGYRITLPEGTSIEGSTFIEMAKRLGPDFIYDVAFENPIFTNSENNKEADFLSLLGSPAEVSAFEEIEAENDEE